MLTTQAAADLTGLTLRQLHLLDENGLVRPRRESNRRRYGQAQLLALLVLGDLKRKELSWRAVRRMTRWILKNSPAWLKRGGELYLVIERSRPAVISSAGRLLEYLKKQTGGAHLVVVSEKRRILEEAWRRAMGISITG